MRSSSRWLLVLPAVALGVATGCCRPGGTGPVAGGPPGVSAREAVLADAKGLQAEPPEAVVGHVNEWGTAGALVVATAGGTRVVVGDQASPPYEQAGPFSFTLDGRHTAYAAREQGKVRVVRDGQAGAPFDEVGPAIFTPDGQHLAYRAVVDGQARLVVDGRQGAPAPIVGEPFLAARQDELILLERPADAARLEVSGWSFALERRSITVIEGGQEAVVSRDGSRLAVAAEEAGQVRVVSLALATPGQRTQGEPFDTVGRLVLDATGTHLAYLGSRGDQSFLVLDGRSAPVEAGHVVMGPVIEPGGQAAAIAYAEGEGIFLARFSGGKVEVGPPYAHVSDLVHTADGKQSAFVVERTAGEVTEGFLVVNGLETAERFDKVVSPRFSPDGKHLVFRARKDGRRFLVVADASGKVLRRHATYEQVFVPSFTPDGASVAYAVKDGSKLRWKVERL